MKEKVEQFAVNEGDVADLLMSVLGNENSSTKSNSKIISSQISSKYFTCWWDPPATTAYPWPWGSWLGFDDRLPDLDPLPELETVDDATVTTAEDELVRDLELLPIEFGLPDIGVILLREIPPVLDKEPTEDEELWDDLEGLPGESGTTTGA